MNSLFLVEPLLKNEPLFATLSARAGCVLVVKVRALLCLYFVPYKRRT